MRKFTNNIKRDRPAISVTALPDIVFILLFFFIMSTSIKKNSYHNKYIQITVPKASELTQAKKKELVSYIYIGTPKYPYKRELGSEAIILVNDKPISINKLSQWCIQERVKYHPKDWGEMITQIQADRDIKIGLIQDVKDILASKQRFKILYTAQNGDIN